MCDESKNKNKKGFTLIELLVVIAIIALLMSIVMPALNRAKAIARSIVCRSNLKQIGLAIHTYTANNNEALPLVYERDFRSSLLTPKGDDGGRGWSWAGLLHETGCLSIDAFICPAELPPPQPDTSFLWNSASSTEFWDLVPKDEMISYGAIILNYDTKYVPWSTPETSSFFNGGGKCLMSKVPTPGSKYIVWDTFSYIYPQTTKSGQDAWEQIQNYWINLMSVPNHPDLRLKNQKDVMRHEANVDNIYKKGLDGVGPNALILDGHVEPKANFLSLTTHNFSW